MTRTQAFDALEGVEVKLSAVRFAVQFAISAGEADVSVLPVAPVKVTLHLLRQVDASLESTYLLRLFAEFEHVLLSLWLTKRRTRPRMQQLIDLVGSSCLISQRAIDAAHDVRRYRNAIVHRLAHRPSLTFEECRSRLGHYMSHLPPKW